MPDPVVTTPAYAQTQTDGKGITGFKGACRGGPPIAVGRRADAATALHLHTVAEKRTG